MDNEGAGEKPGFVAVVFAVFACAARFLDDSRIKAPNHSDSRGTAMIFYERRVLPPNRAAALSVMDPII